MPRPQLTPFQTEMLHLFGKPLTLEEVKAIKQNTPSSFARPVGGFEKLSLHTHADKYGLTSDALVRLLNTPPAELNRIQEQSNQEQGEQSELGQLQNVEAAQRGNIEQEQTAEQPDIAQQNPGQLPVDVNDLDMLRGAGLLTPELQQQILTKQRQGQVAYVRKSPENIQRLQKAGMPMERLGALAQAPAAQQRNLPVAPKPFAPQEFANSEDLNKAIAQRAEAESRAPYQPYEGETIAPPSVLQDIGMAQAAGLATDPEEEVRYQRLARNLEDKQYESAQGELEPYLQEALQNPLEAQERYITPYQDKLMELLRQEHSKYLQEDVLPKIDTQLLKSGAFYTGARDALRQKAIAESEKQLDKSLINLLQGTREQALTHLQPYAERALQAGQTKAHYRGTDIERQMKAAEHQQKAQASRLLHGTVAAEQLQKMGGERQAQRQRALDTAVKKFEAEQNYPFMKTQQLAAITGGMPGQAMLPQSGIAPPQPGMAQIGTGMGAQLLGAMINQNQNRPQGAHGGHVHGYAGGGQPSIGSDMFARHQGALQDILQSHRARMTPKVAVMASLPTPDAPQAAPAPEQPQQDFYDQHMQSQIRDLEQPRGNALGHYLMNMGAGLAASPHANFGRALGEASAHGVQGVKEHWNAEDQRKKQLAAIYKDIRASAALAEHRRLERLFKEKKAGAEHEDKARHLDILEAGVGVKRRKVEAEEGKKKELPALVRTRFNDLMKTRTKLAQKLDPFGLNATDIEEIDKQLIPLYNAHPELKDFGVPEGIKGAERAHQKRFPKGTGKAQEIQAIDAEIAAIDKKLGGR